MNWSQRFHIWYISLLIVVGVCFGTGLIRNWGEWYSPSRPYRSQTEAMLNGQIALSTSAADLERDLVWYDQKVQQVWGLGVPCWRLAFEAVARLFGQPAFPDRIAFAIALFLLVSFSLKVFVHGSEAPAKWTEGLPGYIAVLLATLFPPFLTLCRVRFNVYEEAVAYAYLSSMGLFIGTVAFAKRPRTAGYFAVCLCGGLVGFVRPTMAVYGLASTMLVWFLSRRAGWTWRRSFPGIVLFGVGIVGLLVTNRLRFGSFLEFGHRLNLSATNAEFVFQFYNPFSREGFWSAARELFGGLFFVKNLNGFDAFRENVVPWQSHTVRYRTFYHTTFDWTFLLALGACWMFALSRMVSIGYRKREARPADSLVILGGLWSLLAFIPLFLFYLRFQLHVSRYIFDFAPALAAAMIGLASQLGGRLAALSNGKRGAGILLLAGFITWWGYEIFTARIATSGRAVSQTAMVNILHHKSAPLKPLPDHYVVGENLPELYGIPFNGEGWLNTGEVRCVVTLFVTNLNKLVLQLAPYASRDVADDDYSSIRARVGSEFLKLESIETLPEAKRVTFAAPATELYRKGTQVVFVAFATPENYRQEPPPFRLLRASWGSN